MRSLTFYTPARLMAIAGLAALLVTALLMANYGFEPELVLKPPQAQTMPASPEIEAAWGIRLDHVALIGGGGIIDVRYTVIDPDRAAALLSNLDALPVIRNERNGGELRLTEALHKKLNLDAGRSYYILYANAGNLLRRGDVISLTVGEFTLTPVVVQ